MRQVLNVLSVETNSAFWPLNAGQVEEDEPLAKPLDKTEVFSADPDWMDDCPVQDDKLLISREAMRLIDTVAGGGEIPEDLSIFLRACNHFHIARKYAAQVLDLFELGEAEQVGNHEFAMPINIRNRRLEAAGEVGDAHAEITGALFMSAMEVAAKIGQPKAEACKECGQLRYKISQRVTDVMKKHGGENLARIAKSYYSQRSQYLHEGMMLSPLNYTGTSILQLDPSSPSGCLMQTASPDPNLRDYVGFCMRMTEDEIGFQDAYERLSSEGRCDGPGGMQYKRVLQEWEEAGRPTDLNRFIVVHANMRSDGTYPDYVPS